MRATNIIAIAQIFRKLMCSSSISAFRFCQLSSSLFKTHCQQRIFCRAASTVMSTSEEFKKQGIVPDVVTKAPEKRAKVVFDSGVESNLGNVLTPTQVQHPPKVTWEAEAGKLYSLIMTDPDAPSRKEPKFREWHHWLIVNIPGTELDKGDMLSEYVGAGPPQGTGLHRYVFLIYQQNSKINDPEHGHLTNRSGDKRGGWKAQKFADKHALGDPMAGNFYQAEFDDYVPKLYKQLGAA